MVPVIDGQLHHFTNAGLYDGLFTLYDAETHTLWNHLTGEAEYGPLVGRTLGPPGNQLQMNVRQALSRIPGRRSRSRTASILRAESSSAPLAADSVRGVAAAKGAPIEVARDLIRTRS